MKHEINFNIGVDIEEVVRFSELKYETKKSFYNKIFTKKEIEYCLTKKNPYPHFTARFCAKEAAIKALKNSKLELKNIEIKIEKNKPILNIPKIKNVEVSISHTKNYAIAIVLLYDNF